MIQLPTEQLAEISSLLFYTTLNVKQLNISTMNHLDSFQSRYSELGEPNKLANIFKLILGTRYCMASGLWQSTSYGSTCDKMPLCLSIYAFL